MREATLVATGAVFGTLLRFCCTIILGNTMWPLLAINVLGAGIMGSIRPHPFWSTGVLGGFTSFSAFALFALQPAPLAIAYCLLTVIGCVGAWCLGFQLRSRRESA